MNPLAAFFTVSILLASSTSLAQLPPTFFTSGFPSGFQGFSGFGSPQIVGSSPSLPPSGGSGGRSNTGTTVQGPILFPPAPESRDTSGVVVGASGYGFVPPGVNEILQGRGFQSQMPAFQSSLRQSFGNFFRL